MIGGRQRGRDSDAVLVDDPRLRELSSQRRSTLAHEATKAPVSESVDDLLRCRFIGGQSDDLGGKVSD